ncbi:MAG: FAD-dependent oxidoreductase [Casimicrobiaceae bacterium]
MTTAVRSCDLAVIGGGLVGAAIAYGLADRKQRVTMFDEGDVALRAARGNFGLIWVQGKGLDCAPYAQWTRASARLWPEFASRLGEDSGVNIAFARNGGVHLCLSERELAARAAQVARYSSQSATLAGAEPLRFAMLDRKGVERLLPDIGPGVAGASYCPEDGHVNPLQLLRGLHLGFVARGGELRTDHAVQRIAPIAEGFALTTRSGEIHARRIVLAAGLGNAALAPQVGLAAPVTAQRGQIIVLERMPRWLPLPTEALRQTDNGTVLVGDSQENSASSTTSSGVLAAMARRAVRAFPRLADANVLRTWAALRVLSPDGLPIYQQSRTAPGAFLVSCHSGVTLAAIHALVLAPQIAAGALGEPQGVFSSDRFDGQAAA